MKSGPKVALSDPTNMRNLVTEREMREEMPNLNKIRPTKNLTMWHVYIIRCRDTKLYTGITNNLDRRLTEHNTGHGGRFTRVRRPVKLVYSETLISKSTALKKEAAIKKLTRKEKLDLVKTS